MQDHSFWLTVRLNTGVGVRFLYPPPRRLRSGAIGPAFPLAGQSEPCIRGSALPLKKIPKRNTEIVYKWLAGSDEPGLVSSIYAIPVIPVSLQRSYPVNNRPFYSTCPHSCDHNTYALWSLAWMTPSSNGPVPAFVGIVTLVGVLLL